MKFNVRYYNRETEKFETKTIENVSYITITSQAEVEPNEFVIIYDRGYKTFRIKIIDLLYINNIE